jgi:hypothetical protein
MSFQFISDSAGKTTGVFIPIEEWNELKNKYKGIEQEESHIPEWQMNAVRERRVEYTKNPKQELDFDATMDDIEKDLFLS